LVDKLADLPKGHRRGPRATKTLKDAYQRVFSGHGSADDARLVLTDLAKFSGFMSVSPQGVANEQLQYAEGQRSVYARIHDAIRMTPAEREWLEQAVRDEAFASIEENKEIV
jgi:hypothetical protein